MLINWKNIETGLICLCYIIGIGSILFGSLSGNEYGDYFVTVGVLALVLVTIHTTRIIRRTAEYKENKNSNEDLNRNSTNH